MTRPWTIIAALAAVAAAAIPLSGPAVAAPATMRNCQTVQVTQTVDVHYDPNFTSRVVRVAHRGDRETVCLLAIGRSGEYRACGRRGHDWYLVRGGFIPDVCARRMR